MPSAGARKPHQLHASLNRACQSKRVADERWYAVYEEMPEDLDAFLRQHEVRAEGPAVWGGGAFSFRVTAYLASVSPPLQYVTSVRSIVYRGDAVLIVRQPDGSSSLLPGGRREVGEQLEDTLRREVLEETGWTLQSPAMLGFLHFHHLTPRPEGYAYPYPGFLQVVYVAAVGEYRPGAMVQDEYVVDAAFHPVRDVLLMEWTPGERLFLDEALARHAARIAHDDP